MTSNDRNQLIIINQLVSPCQTSIFKVDQRFLIHRIFFSLVGALDKSEAAVGAALEAVGLSTGPGADGTVSVKNYLLKGLFLII